jgi:hypothetical protein
MLARPGPTRLPLAAKTRHGQAGRHSMNTAEVGSRGGYVISRGCRGSGTFIGGIDNKSLFDGCRFQPSVETKDCQSLRIFLDAYQSRRQLTCIGSP